MKHRAFRWLLALPLSVLPACGAEDPGSQPAESTEAPAAETDKSVVASADVGYGTVRFHEYHGQDGSVVTAVSQETDNTLGWTPLHGTVAAGHTNLEIFMALLPDQDPPESFIEAHAQQAAAKGRTSDAVVAAAFDRDAPVEKGIDQCRAWTAPTVNNCYSYTYSNRLYRDNLYGTAIQSLTAYNAGYASTTFGICNVNDTGLTVSGNVQGRVNWDNDARANGAGMQLGGWTPLIKPGTGWVWFGLNLSSSSGYRCADTTPGGLCIAAPVTYQLQGKSLSTSANNRYDLYGAIITGSTYVGGVDNTGKACVPPPPPPVIK